MLLTLRPYQSYKRPIFQGSKLFVSRFFYICHSANKLTFGNLEFPTHFTRIESAGFCCRASTLQNNLRGDEKNQRGEQHDGTHGIDLRCDAATD